MYPPVVLRRVLLPNLCLRKFQVGTVFLEICTTIESWVCSSNTSPISPSSPNLLLLAWPCDVSTLLHSTRCLLCQWQESWQLRPVLYTEWFRQGSKSVRPVAVPFMPNFPNFLLSTMSSVLSRTSSLFSLVMGIFKDVKLDAPVSRTIASACFWSAS